MALDKDIRMFKIWNHVELYNICLSQTLGRKYKASHEM